MTRIMAAHQPNYLPYLGFFDKLRCVDELGTEPGVFIIRDDAQYVKKEFHDRNKIRLNEGWKWLRVPVEKKMAPLNTIEIKEDGMISNIPWADYHLRLIETNYKKTPFFDKFYSGLKKIYLNPGDKLVDFNMRIIKYLAECFGIKTKIVLFSDIPKIVKGRNATESLVNISKAVKADVYLAGAGSKVYLDISCFNEIKLKLQDYEHPVYEQRFPEFEPFMSAIDALFNIGYLPNSGEIVESSR
ncbi:MAG: hypothetical protein DRP06_03625 [Candidatus Aenigmatarchaeota archaeon]|nr:MAG: hypothetical protein DRP06_03625 [Candidatus Aenigmarchaeota archaeon]